MASDQPRNSAESRFVTLARKCQVVFEMMASKCRVGLARSQRRPSSVTILTFGLLSSEATSGSCAISLQIAGIDLDHRQRRDVGIVGDHLRPGARRKPDHQHVARRRMKQD